MTISQAMSICHKNGIKVFPEPFEKWHKLGFQLKGNKPCIYGPVIKCQKELQEALFKTYIYHASKL